MSGHTIHEVDPDDDAAFSAWHHVYAVAERHEVGDVVASWQLEEVRAAIQDDGSHTWSGAWAGVIHGETVAAGWLSTPLLDNLELAELAVHVHPSHRRRGFGSAMLSHVEAVSRDRGRRILTGLASWPYAAGSDGTGVSGPLFRGCPRVARLGDFQKRLS